MSKNHKVSVKRARRKRYVKRKKKELTGKLKLMKVNKPQPVREITEQSPAQDAGPKTG